MNGREPPTSAVIGFLRVPGGRVVVIRKQQPQWQAGRLNGVGGHLEEGEVPLAGMQREWAEEIGPGDPPSWRRFAILKYRATTMHFFAAETDLPPRLPRLNDVGERVELLSLSDLGGNEVVPNLRWLLPLAFFDPFRPFVEARG